MTYDHWKATELDNGSDQPIEDDGETMTQFQFRKGQEVEVLRTYDGMTDLCKGKILHPGGDKYIGEWWYVAFPDGTRGVFDVAHVRAVAQNDSYGQSLDDRAHERWNQP
jgi:hypothetical protein